MTLPALLALAPNVQRRLEQGLRTGRIAHPFVVGRVQTVLGVDATQATGIAADLGHLHLRGVVGPAVATLLELTREQVRALDRPHLVWTGPTVPGLFARSTRAVFEELIDAAHHRIWLSSYALHDGKLMFKPLADRMDDAPDLHVSLLLNIGRPYGSTTTPEDLVARFTDDLWSKHWPGARRPAVFYDPRAVELPQGDGVLHAKALVVDECMAFVGSANLTEAAFERNYEAGVVSRDRALAGSLARHFRTLVEHGKVVPLAQ